MPNKFAYLLEPLDRLNKVTGDDADEKDQKLRSKSEYVQAFQMFQNERPFTDIAIELDIESPTFLCYYEDTSNWQICEGW